MSSDPKSLYPPNNYVDYRGLVRVQFLYDDQVINMNTASGEFHVPECPVFPRIIFQAKRNDGQLDGPVWTFEKELDHGRGAWVTYDERLHAIPKSQDLVVDGAESEESEKWSGGAPLPIPALRVPVEELSFDDAEDEDVETDDVEDEEDEVTSD